MRADERDPLVERGLDALAGAPTGALSDALERELAALTPVTTRRPRRELVMVAAVSLLYAAGLVGVLGVRGDLAGLPLAWLVAYGAVWLASFLAITTLVVVPARGQVLPRVRLASWLALLAGLTLVGFGLLFAREASTASVLTSLRHGHGCLAIGLVTAIVPIGLALWVVRGSLPVGSRRAALAVGAAAGSLGGLALHLHCPLTDRYHLGLVHGGVVLLAAALAGAVALIRPGR